MGGASKSVEEQGEDFFAKFESGMSPPPQAQAQPRPPQKPVVEEFVAFSESFPVQVRKFNKII